MRAVVITGASSGIGRASAIALDRLGFDVFAGVRQEADARALESIASERLTAVHIDVTDAASIATAKGLVEEVVAGVGLAGLVNSAGTTVPCPVEFLPLSEFRHQLEVNLTGHLAVIQTFLPLLRRAHGRIVSVSSVGGKVGGPLMAPYVAAKHGLEGLSDVLRLELEPMGVGVAVIEPGLINTGMDGKLQRDTRAWLEKLPPDGRERYGPSLRAMADTVSREAGRGSSPDVVAAAVVHALTSAHPRTRYPVGVGAQRMLLLRRLMPDRWVDRMMLRALGLRHD